MKTIGLIAGMSWESSAEYYRIINEEVRDRLGGLHSARILMYSLDFQEIEDQQREGRWDEAASILAGAARRLELGGADFLLICTNTMHKVAPEVEAAVEIPLLHIADATAEEAHDRRISTAALLGTRFTMEQDFLKGRLSSRHGLRVLVPPPKAREIVHRVIYDELCLGRVLETSRRTLAGIVEDLKAAGAEGVILGCTELPLLLRQEDAPLPLIDTLSVHARRAVDLALQAP